MLSKHAATESNLRTKTAYPKMDVHLMHQTECHRMKIFIKQKHCMMKIIT